MLLRALILAFSLILSFATGEYSSPVFVWGVSTPAKSSLQTVPQNDFADLVAPLLKSHMVVAFQEEHLSSKDFLCQKTDSSESCYAHLSGFSPKTYYARVENPAEALRSLTKTREYNIVDSNGKLQTPLECTPGKVTFVSFDDVTANGRADVLEEHDEAIADITKELHNCRVVYLYMSKSGSEAKSRVRRAIAPGGGFIFNQSNQFMIYWSDLSYNDGSKKEYTPITITAMTLKNVTEGSSFTVSLTGGSAGALEFLISLGNDGYFTMSKITYAGQNFYSSLLTAPKTFSYHCGNLTVNTIPVGADTSNIAYLKWNSLQFQAPFSARASTNAIFYDSWDCVPFFTPGILSGLFVVIILLAITFTGICWMIDINTMDRFDDPKGKTVTINANE